MSNVTTYTVHSTKDSKQLGSGMTALPISRTDGKKGKSGLCIFVPELSDSVITLVQYDTAGRQFILNAIDDLRSRLASGLNKRGKSITSDGIGITSLLVAMKLENESQRFTKDSIATWFAEHLGALINARIAAKMPGIAADKLDKLVTGYLDAFQILANNPDNRFMPTAIKNSLLKALELLPEDHDTVTAEEIASRLSVIGEASAMLVTLDD